MDLLRWDSAEAYFAEKPLTDYESRRGAALRVLGCRWVSQEGAGAHVWVLLYATRTSDGEVPTASLTGPRLGMRILAQVALPYQGVSSLPEGWRVAEIHVTMPSLKRPFSLACAGTHATVPLLKCYDYLRNSYAMIRNAAADETGYEAWFLAQRGSFDLEPCSEGPLMSVVMPAYKTPPQFFREVLQSMVDQLYTNWELVVVNASPEDEDMHAVLSEFSADERIRVVEVNENLGIAGNTNVGIEAARGDYVSFLDHDDLVEPEALLLYVCAIQERAGRGLDTDLLYCDEDTINDEGHYLVPLFKPGANIDLLYSNNYAIHWLTVSRRVLDASLRSPSELDGAQDYDLTFKAYELGGADAVVRIPHVMYHWRVHEGSTNFNANEKPYAQMAGLRAIEQHLERRGLVAAVSREEQPFTYRTTFSYPDGALPPIACYVVGGEPSEALEAAAEAYRAAGGKVTLGTLHSGDYAQCAGEKDAYARACESADASLVAFLPGDIANLSRDFFATAAGYFIRPEVGVVSARVVRADGLAEYVNATLRPDGSIMCLNKYLPEWDEGYIGRAIRPIDSLLANPTACFIRRSAYASAGGFDEAFVSAAYALADLCQKLREQKILSVYAPFVEVRRMIPASQLGCCLAAEASNDRDLFAGRYERLLAAGDPNHNPNFDPASPYFLLR